MEIQSSPIKKEFYDKLSYDKIKINWNKKPIPMDLFLSFLTVETTRNHNCLGCYTGWTELRNDEIKLMSLSGNGRKSLAFRWRL